MKLPHGGLSGMEKFRKDKIRSSFYDSSKILKNFRKNSFPDDGFSVWERRILRKLRKSGFSIETKFRNFPVRVENEIFEYIPDFLVKDFEYKGREILIEAHEKISEDDVEKYRKFRSIFGVSYYMIMIVTDEELRIWNEYDQGKQGFFNKIWTDDDIEFLIEDLRKKREDYEKKISKYGQRAFCPSPPKGHGCGKKAVGFKQVEKLFGYRGKRVQSLCRKCRSEHSSDRRK